MNRKGFEPWTGAEQKGRYSKIAMKKFITLATAGLFLLNLQGAWAQREVEPPAIPPMLEGQRPLAQPEAAKEPAAPKSEVEKAKPKSKTKAGKAAPKKAAGKKAAPKKPSQAAKKKVPKNQAKKQP